MVRESTGGGIKRHADDDQGHDAELLRLEDRLSDALKEIKRLNELDAPHDLAGQVLRAVRPKQPSVLRRLLLWADSPRTVTFTPWKLLPVAAALLLIAFSPLLFTDLEVGQYHARRPPLKAPVVFTYHNGRAGTVQVIGTFNDWDPKGYEMRFDSSTQRWSLKLALPPGRYEYSFLVNGNKSVPDPKAVITRDDGFGNKNSVIFVDDELSI